MNIVDNEMTGFHYPFTFNCIYASSGIGEHVQNFGFNVCTYAAQFTLDLSIGRVNNYTLNENEFSSQVSVTFWRTLMSLIDDCGKRLNKVFLLV